MGGWGTITGFLRQGHFGAGSASLRLASFGKGIAAFWEKERSRILIAATLGLGVLFLGSVFYLRSAEISGNPQTYLYLEIGGTLISFCYAANA